MSFLYKAFCYVGLMSVAGAFLVGFQAPTAAAANDAYLYNVLLYGAFIAVHFVMTLPTFKKAVFANPAGTPRERRVYIVVSIVTWLLVYFLHKPVPGFAYAAPVWLELLGTSLVLLGIFIFFEFATFGFLNAFLAVPGAEMSHSAGGETPLMTEGSYAKVRHPMYQGATVYCFASLLIHPNATQLLFATMVALSFLLFIPVEEAKLLRSRGKEYQDYMTKVRWRVFPGLW